MSTTSLIEVVSRLPMMFPKKFCEYIASNGHVYSAFEHEAKRIVARGRTHYSARTIIEVLRHNSSLTETGSGSTWKLNNINTPYLARLFAILNPESAGLFDFRTPKSTGRKTRVTH